MFHLTTAPHTTESQEFCLAANTMVNIVYMSPEKLTSISTYMDS